MLLMSKKDSIYFQLLRLLILSGIIAAVFFSFARHICNHVIENYYETSDYEERKNEIYLNKLQQYIKDNNISSKDTAALKKWVKKQNIIILRVYMNDKKIFDSDYPDKDLWEEDIESELYDWETYYDVEFSDGTASVGMIGLYEYQLYNFAFVAQMVASFLIFVFVTLVGIRQKMKYISKLSEEIAILEGGSLDYEITVKGRDELTVLAAGLNNMRISFRRMIEQEAEMVNENSRIITEMSHDLRTPVTSVMLYTEILKKGSYRDEKQLMEYLNKIEGKAKRMKQLADHLFEYVLVSGEKTIELEAPESCEVVFFDLISETCSYLEQNGFETEFRGEWPEKNVRVYTEYVVRILDNISSNIIKYADTAGKVVISSVNTDQKVGFRFENMVKQQEDKKDSNGVGLQSIRNMMKKMNGRCSVTQEEKSFAIEIQFPGTAFRR